MDECFIRKSQPKAWLLQSASVCCVGKIENYTPISHCLMPGFRLILKKSVNLDTTLPLIWLDIALMKIHKEAICLEGVTSNTSILRNIFRSKKPRFRCILALKVKGTYTFKLSEWQKCHRAIDESCRCLKQKLRAEDI